MLHTPQGTAVFRAWVCASWKWLPSCPPWTTPSLASKNSLVGLLLWVCFRCGCVSCGWLSLTGSGRDCCVLCVVVFGIAFDVCVVFIVCGCGRFVCGCGCVFFFCGCICSLLLSLVVGVVDDITVAPVLLRCSTLPSPFRLPCCALWWWWRWWW